ncbi:MAG: hypothetical protein ACXADH_09145 [Candidatus Kariarchaeaceae archaeon]
MSRERVIGNSIGASLRTVSSNEIQVEERAEYNEGDSITRDSNEEVPEDSFTLDTRSRPSDDWYSIDE